MCAHILQIQDFRDLLLAVLPLRNKGTLHADAVAVSRIGPLAWGERRARVRKVHKGVDITPVEEDVRRSECCLHRATAMPHIDKERVLFRREVSEL